MHQQDSYFMKFINHIFNKHKIPATLIVASVLMLVVYFISNSLAATTYGPGDTLDPAEGPGSATVEIPTGWGLEGTSGTVDGTSFIGTTDNIPLNFRVNNIRAGKIDPTMRLTAFGYLSDAPTGFDNTAIGYSALAGGSSSASQNTAVGSYALPVVTLGSTNTAIGFNALYSNTEGAVNMAAGYQALYSNITGFENTANGFGALYSNITGFENTANGSYALYSNITGNYNTALGYRAGYNSIGDGNVFIGYETGQTSGTGSNELWIDNGDNAIPLIFGDLLSSNSNCNTV